MIPTKTLTLVIAAVVVIGGMAAVGAAAPADQMAGNASDAAGEHVPDDAGDVDEGDANASAADVGPSDGLPGAVPDHVSEIHETIESYLDGSIGNLGQALQGLLGNGAGSGGGPAN